MKRLFHAYSKKQGQSKFKILNIEDYSIDQVDNRTEASLLWEAHIPPLINLFKFREKETTEKYRIKDARTGTLVYDTDRPGMGAHFLRVNS